MLSFYRSGLLVLTLVIGFMAELQAQVRPSTHADWVSDVVLEELQDKSVLTEYFGQSTSNESPDVFFRVGFIPRFGCAPLITFKFGKESTNGLIPTVFQAGLESLSVTIDGTVLSFPALVDEDGDHYSIYLNTTLQRRITTKLRVEVGNKLGVTMANSQRLSFSLSGSRDAISIANQNCRRHDPSR